MEIVENKTFYHIYRKVPWNPYPLWEVGQTYFVGKENNPFIKYYDVANVTLENNIESLQSAVGHYQKYVREQLFEEVRREFFPNSPSRYRCLWVIEENIEALKFWWNMFDNTGTIVKLKLNGKVHKGNEEYLKVTGNSRDFIRQQAFKYWSGSSGMNEYELVFEGFVTVESYINLEKLEGGD